jgi:hypothetical protein
MRISIECGLDIVQPFEDCDEARSLARYADAVAEAAREIYPETDVTWRVDTRAGFGLRIEGLDDTEALRAEADRIWETQTWLVDPRAEALAAHTGEAVTHEDGDRYTAGSAEWLVLTESEADETAAERIRDSLWAFRADFLADHCRVTLSRRAVEALARVQAEMCEDANDLIRALVNVDDVVRDAIGTDGRGHYLAGYDGREVPLDGGHYGYRVG